MATAVVQSANHNNGVGTALAIAFSTSITGGNQLLVSINTVTNVTLNSITDSQSNTWSIDAGPIAVGSGLGYQWFAHAENVTAGSTTVTANFASSVNAGMQLYEVSGLGASSFDAAPYATGSAATIANTFTPTRQPAFAMAILESNNANITSIGTTDGWTVAWAASYNNYEKHICLAINSSGSRNASGSVSSSTWVSAAAVYMAAAGGASTFPMYAYAQQ